MVLEPPVADVLRECGRAPETSRIESIRGLGQIVSDLQHGGAFTFTSAGLAGQNAHCADVSGSSRFRHVVHAVREHGDFRAGTGHRDLSASMIGSVHFFTFRCDGIHLRPRMGRGADRFHVGPAGQIFDLGKRQPGVNGAELPELIDVLPPFSAIYSPQPADSG